MDAESAPRRGLTGRSLELAYRIGIVIKGLDGLVELIGGLVLWLTPALLISLFAPLEHTDSDDRMIRILIAQWAGRLDDSMADGPQLFVILFLLSHGVVKIVLVYCLLKEYHWVYPYAIWLLGLFTLYQLYVLVQTPSIGMAVLAALDLAIIWLVWREWGALRARRGSSKVSR